MADFSNIIEEINTNLPDNNTQAITAEKLRTTLIDLTEQIDTVQDDFESEVNQAISEIHPVFATNQSINSVSIINNLTTGGINNVLSAEQGKILYDTTENNLKKVGDALEYTEVLGLLKHNGTIDTTTLPNAKHKVIVLPQNCTAVYINLYINLNTNYSVYWFVDDNDTIIEKLPFSNGKFYYRMQMLSVPTGATKLLINSSLPIDNLPICSNVGVEHSVLSAIKTLEIDTDNIESDITNIESDITNIESDITNIEEQIIQYTYYETPDETGVGYLRTNGTIATNFGGTIRKFNIPEGYTKVYVKGNSTMLVTVPSWALYWVVNANGEMLYSKRVSTNPEDFDDEIDLTQFTEPTQIWSSVSNSIIYVESDTTINEKIAEIEDTIEILQNQIDNHWNGKTIVWLGTSIPAGQGGSGANYTYPKQVCDYLGATLVNSTKPGLSQMADFDTTNNVWVPKSLGSTCLTVDECTTAYNLGLISSNYSAYSYENTLLNKNADLYVFDVEPNNNDVGSADDLAAFNWHLWKYNDNSSFASHRNTYIGALIYEIDKLLDNKPDAVIVFIGEYIPLTTEDAYAIGEITISFCEKFHIGYINLSTKMGYNGKNKSVWVNTDLVHPKQVSYDRMAKMLINELKLIA